jgi:hypothetical protein
MIAIRLMLGAAWLIALPSMADPSIVAKRVTQLKPLMLNAIDSPTGKAQAWLEGELADRIRIQIKAPAKSPVLATVRTVQEFRPGCKRLHVALSLPEHKMETTSHTWEPFLVWYELNLCRDGRPPQVSDVGKDGEAQP